MTKQCEKTKVVGPRPLSWRVFARATPEPLVTSASDGDVRVSMGSRAPALFDGSKTLSLSSSMIASICWSLKESLRGVSDPLRECLDQLHPSYHFPRRGACDAR